MVKVLWNIVRVLVHSFNMFFIGCLMDNYVKVFNPDNLFLIHGTIATVGLIVMAIASSLFWQYGFDD
jgi:uncharacterized membrane protein YczE